MLWGGHCILLHPSLQADCAGEEGMQAAPRQAHATRAQYCKRLSCMGVCWQSNTCSFRWQSLSRGVSSPRLASVSAGQFFRLRFRREVMRAMAAQPPSDTMVAFWRLRLVRWCMPHHFAKPLPARTAAAAYQQIHGRVPWFSGTRQLARNADNGRGSSICSSPGAVPASQFV